MARTPTIPDDEYREILQFLVQQGYDIGKVKRCPRCRVVDRCSIRLGAYD